MKTLPSLLSKYSGAESAPPEVKNLHHEKGWVKKPVEIISDPALSAADRCIYDSVAYFAYRSGGECRESTTIIGALTNLSKRQAIISIEKLCGRGYIERKRTRNRRYPDALRLTAAVRGREVKGEAVEAPADASSLRECWKCSKLVKRVAVNGWCRECNRDAKLAPTMEECERLGAGVAETPELGAAVVMRMKKDLEKFRKDQARLRKKGLVA